ncbi:protein plastid transcriptionally active 16, chloroplastic [Phalaenopsis equestris]|uniref:protein plastid transcriptionally active 16, chloroplastic n=1 Tax=Phalaenopsis equestris TaxID=78828 RepID=UPI0009E48BB3|nr:protein plastid transcriptionally active 16, chloroplastic [Phalaenopsis equestris]XP_020585429.1 protein plastid transcriptionally active 16, chloroplastic [Phalaenopsis equestris]XP_020585430.1 protein plastid transcriptionally active 16, chloroplastic [Phalaenopsis equestris]XP_020585431.1 protein plastid transcriptionally active 16, chloroplastic [Phalaenopsis equestris]
MAPALTSQYSFSRLITPPHPKLGLRLHQKPPTTIFCRKPNFTSPETNKPSRFFFFDLPKLPDPKSTSLFSTRLRKDPNTVFVAGATGQTGARIVLTLLRRGFSVRAGVPDIASAQDLARLAAAYKTISPEESRRLNAVESSFADPESIAKAIGLATKAVVTVGSGENGPASVVTADDAFTVVRAAGLAGVGHLAVVYDSQVGGPGSGQSTYNVFDGITSFFSNLFVGAPMPLTMAGLLAKLVETDVVAYTFVKARLTEDYAPESSFALVVGKEGSSSDGTTTLYNSKVSKSQIAKLVADVFSNASVAENKVIEVSTDASATSKPVVELLSAIPEDGRRKAYAEALAKAKAKAEEEAIIALEKAREAETAAKKLEEEVQKLSKQQTQAASLAEEAQARAEAAGSTLEDLISKAKGLGEFSWQKLSSQITTAVSPNSSNSKSPPPTRIATTRGQANASILPPRKAVLKQQQSKPIPKQKQVEREEKATKADVRSVFGGLFKQETIYIDDD